MVCGCLISTARWTYGLFSNFPFGGLHSWGILLIIPLELQGKRHQPFSMAQPKKNLCLGLCGVRSPHHASPIRNMRFWKPPSGRPSFSKVLLEHLVVLYPQYAENTVFLIFADGFHDSDHFIGYSFGISKNKISTVFYGTAFSKRPQCPFPRRQAGLCKKAAGNRCCWLAEAKAFEERDCRHLPRHVTQKKTSWKKTLCRKSTGQCAQPWKERLCHRKRLILFSLKFQGNNQ